MRHRVQNAHGLEGDQDLDADEGTDGEDFAMGEVDEFQYPIHHGVAEGDGCIDKADGQAIDQHLGQVDQRVGEERNFVLIQDFRSNRTSVQQQRQE